jgi:hypothetical protein
MLPACAGLCLLGSSVTRRAIVRASGSQSRNAKCSITNLWQTFSDGVTCRFAGRSFTIVADPGTRQPMTRPTPILKDEEHECPVPSAWRQTLREIVDGLKEGNYRLDGIARVDPIDQDTADQIAHNIREYGCTLTLLPDETWETSVCIWLMDYWEVLVDLFTIEEGISDLIVHLNVFEEAEDFIFRVHLVYVP